MSQTSSLPEVTSPDNAQSLGTYAPVMEIEDSHFQLPIRRHPRILSSIDEDSPTHTNGAPAGMESGTIDGSDSESSQVILTPEAGLSEEEEMELHGSKEAVLDNSRVMNSEDVKDFYGAVGSGDLKRVKYHIDQGISVNSKTMNGYTPLVIAILEAQLEMTRLLLDHGASVHQRVNKTPPIVYAAMTAAPAPQFLKLLLEYGASPSTVHGSYYYNVLHWAAFIGNVDAVDFLISVGTDMEQTCSQGRTSLLIASTNGNTCIVKVLLAKGADINHRSHNGATALGWAACHDHVDTVRSLLEEGLDINGYDNRGISPLWGASSLGSIEVVELLIEKGAAVDYISREQKHSTPVMAAAIAGHADVVQVLIDHGADLTIPNGDGSSVLEAAIAGRHADTVGLLLEVLGGDDYPQESIALDIAIAKSLTVIKSIMAKEGLFQPDAGVDVTTSQSKYRELIDRILMQGGDLIKPHAMSNMMSTALHEGDLAVVMALLASGCDPNRYLPPGYTTPLQIAISRRSISIVKALLKQGADPTLPTRNAEGPNYTPLHQALITLDSDEYRDTTIIDLLLKTWQCKLMTGENARSTALEYVLSHYSAWDHGLAEIMTFRMLQYTRDIQNDRSDDGATLMHAAVWHGRTDLASILITRRLDINVTDNQGYTPFLLECHRSTRLLRFLLSNGANPHGKDVNNQTALHAAASQGDIGIITFLFRIGLPINVRDQNDYTPFTWALISGQEDTALHLLNLGAKFPHKPLRRGRTMLHIASSLNMSRLTAKILESPSLALLVNARDDMGWSPLALSCRKADPDVVEALIDAGADTQISPHNMLDRPLHLALRAGNVAVAKCLIARGADVNVKGEQGHTALHIAEDVEVVEMLLAHGAKVRVLDNVGRTPLCECEDAGIAQLLITHGANVNHREEDGWTGLHRAVESGDIEMFNVLLKAGGDVGARTRDDGLNVIERIEEVKDRALRVALEEGIAGMRV